MSQLNFFMTKEEIMTRLKGLLSNGEYLVFKGVFFDNQKPIPVLNIDELENFNDLIIWINNDICDPICTENGKGNYEGKFLFDYYKQPIIEFENCIINDKLISPGRLFFKSGWIENSELRKLHTKKANKMVRQFNLNLIDISKPFKISSDIKEMIFNGYEIELGISGSRLNEKDFKEIYNI